MSVNVSQRSHLTEWVHLTRPVNEGLLQLPRPSQSFAPWTYFCSSFSYSSKEKVTRWPLLVHCRSVKWSSRTYMVKFAICAPNWGLVQQKCSDKWSIGPFYLDKTVDHINDLRCTRRRPLGTICHSLLQPVVVVFRKTEIVVARFFFSL